MASHDPKKLLVYEPRTEGHHPGWLRFIVEDLLSGGFELTVALDSTPGTWSKLEHQLGPCLSGIKILPVKNERGALRGGNHLKTIQMLRQEAQVDRVFLCELDEIASS